MIKLCNDKLKNAEKIFAYTEETVIRSCLQGTMGELYADDDEQPTCAQARLSDFSFLSGDALNICASELVKNITPGKTWYLVPENERWAELIEAAFCGKCERFMRYAIKKEPGVFDVEKLRGFTKKLPDGYELRMIDRELYYKALENKWSEELVSNLKDYEDFAAHAVGAVALYDGELAAGASTFSYYNEGIEIEVDTNEKHRRKGLATACAAVLILKTLEKGLYPSWDAATRISVALAEKLGYHFSHEYVTYAVKI